MRPRSAARTRSGGSVLGRLQPGALADLIVVELGPPHHGQVIDPIQTLMLGGKGRAGQGRDVATVMIDGRFVMTDRVIPGSDEAGSISPAQGQFERLMAKYPERTLGHPPVTEISSNAYPVIRRPSRRARPPLLALRD